ncbi:unnamed protein product, partial [Sphenostylis stenocarpa]
SNQNHHVTLTASFDGSGIANSKDKDIVHNKNNINGIQLSTTFKQTMEIKSSQMNAPILIAHCMRPD